MKKKFFILISLILLAMPTARAAQKCVFEIGYDTNSQYAGQTTGYCINYTAGTVDWSSPCYSESDRSGQPVLNVRGIGICSNESGSGLETRDSINISEDASANVHCWCKMTYPAETKWLHSATYSSNAQCVKSCARNCIDGDGSSIQWNYMKHFM